MSLRAVDSQRSFYHTEYLARNLFGPANRYRLFREKIRPGLRPSDWRHITEN